MAQPQTLPHIGDLRSSSAGAQTTALDLLFEPSPAIHSLLLPVVRVAEYDSYAGLIDACHERLRRLRPGDAAAADEHLLHSVVGSHPRLGAAKVPSAQSAAEQASLQQPGPGDGAPLAALNAEYEARFPGLRYVVFVAGRPRAEIVRDMRARIERGDYAREVDAALQAMRDIAQDRASKLPQQAPQT
ncbi:hypothetical protein CDD83_8761 [Cordyceps sp. RAO-2017]|nr:hypothetical protein CDD83_8761 [Cordyceps sp. RAO-2017]